MHTLLQMVLQASCVIAGYGDVAPTTRTERIIAMVIMAVGRHLQAHLPAKLRKHEWPPMLLAIMQM